MDEDGLPTLFLDTRPDFRFQFHLRCYEKKKKKYRIGKNCPLEFVEIIILVRYGGRIL